MAFADPSALHGRHGPAACIMAIECDLNGVSTTYTPCRPRRTTSQRDFPLFAPEGVTVSAGRWYYEVELETDGCIQIGAYIPGKFKELSGRQNGVGDGVASWAYDGSKGCVYASKVSITTNIPKSTKGDRVGFLLDMNAGTIAFSKNGQEFANVALADNNSGYVAGKDALQVGGSLSGRMTVAWFFEADELKFTPPDALPLQLNPTFPLALLGTVKAPDADDQAAVAHDPLSFYNSKVDFDQAFTFFGHATSEDKELTKQVTQFAEARGAFFEYGLNHKLSRFLDSGKKLCTVIKGELPKLEVQRGSKNAEDYMKDAQADIDDRRGMVWMVCALAHVFPTSKAALELATKIKAAIEEFDSCAVEAFLKLRYIAALEDRKKNKVLEYGLLWHLERFENELNKDRSKMSAAQQQDFAKEVGKTAEKFVTWRNWFLTAVSDIPFHTAALPLVDVPLAKFNSLFDPEAMAKEAAQKARDAALIDLNKEIERGKKRIEDAWKEFDRFPERAEEGIRKLNEQVEDWEKKYKEAVAAAPEGSASKLSPEAIAKLGAAAQVTSDAFGSWKAELAVATQKWKNDENFRLLKREAQDQLRECKSKLNEAYGLADHYREEEAQAKLFKAIEMVTELKARPGFLGLDFLDEFFFGSSGYEALKSKAETKIYDVTKNRACNEHARLLRGHVSQMASLFDHYRHEDSLSEYNKSLERFEEIKSLCEDYRNQAELAEAVVKYNAYIPKFLQEYKERVVFVQARDKVGDLSRKLSMAQDMVDHYRETEALEAAAKVEEGLDELKHDLLLGTAPQVVDFSTECAEKLSKIRAKANFQIIDREIHEVLRVLEGTYDEVQSHFDHYRFEHCLQSLAKYKELGNDLDAEKRYRGRADVEEALNKFDTRIPEFEKTYRDKMASRALDEDLRLAKSDFNTANDMFQHSRFDECLQELQKAREKVDALAKNETYCDGGVLSNLRDSFVKESREETIPQFLAKYTEKVVSRKAGDVAREIRSSINTAKNQLDHCQFELFLVTINKAGEQIAEARPSDDANLPLDAEPWLIYNHASTQDAINTASKDLFELTHKYNEEQFDRKTNDVIRNLKGPLGDAKHLLDHCNFEGSLTALSKAQDALSELALITSAKAASVVAESTKEIQEFQQQYTAVISKRRDDDLARAVRSEINSAKDMFSHYRNEDTLKAISKTRELIDDVTAQGSAEVQKEIPAWNQQLQELEQQYDERVLTREATDSIAAIRSELKFAADHHDHHRDEYCLVSLNAAREKAAELIINQRISKLPQVVAYLAEFNATQPEWDAKINARILEKETSENVRQLKSALAELKQAFDHHQNEKAVTVYNKIQDELIGFTVDPRFSSQSSVQQVATEAQTQGLAFLEDYRNRVVSNKFQEHQRNANHKFSDAVDKLGRSMFIESMEAFSETRELIGQIGGDPLMFGFKPADDFIGEFGPKLIDFAAQIVAKQRDRALQEAKRDLLSFMTRAREDFDHHRDELSLEQLNKAREFLDAFERGFGMEQDFIQEQRKEIGEFEKTYCERVFNAELARRERKVTERRNAAKDAFDHFRFEEAIRSLSEADEAAQDIATDDRFLHLDRVNAFLKEHITAAAASRSQLTATLNQRAAEEALRNIKSNIAEAKSCYEHYRFDQSLGSAQKAIELIDEAEISGTIANAADLSPLRDEIAAFKKKFQDERLVAEADAQVRGIHSILSSAKFMLSHNRNEDCMKSLQQAREEATKLGDSKFTGLPAITNFFAEWPALFKGIETELSDKLFSIRVRDATSDVKSALHEAETCVSHHMHERAMNSIQKTRDLLGDLQDETNDLASIASVIAFVQENSVAVRALSQRLADELFSREVDEVLRNVKFNVDRADQFFSRFAYEAALQSFNAAKEVVDVATNESDSKIASSKTLVSYVDGTFKPFVISFSKKYADAVLLDEARNAASDVKARLARCVLFLDRNVREKCIEELVGAQEAATAAFAADDSMLKSLTVAAEVLAEVKSVHERVSKTFLQKDADDTIRAAKKIAARVQLNQQRLLDCTADLEALAEAVAELLGTDAKKQPVASIFSALPEVTAFIVNEIQPIFKTAKKSLYDDAAASSSSSGKKSGGASAGHNYDEDPAILGKIITSRWPQIAELRKGLFNKAIGPDVHPRYFSGLKVMNQAARNAATSIKELEKDVMGSYDWSGNHATRCYPFVQNIMECNELSLRDYVKGIRQLEGEIGDAEKCKADELLQQVLSQYDKWMTAWTETKVHFKNVEKIVLRYRAMRKGQELLRELFEECREVSGFSSSTHLSRSKFSDFFSIDSLYGGLPSGFQLFPFKWQSIWNGRGSPDQHEMFYVCIKVADILIDTMKGWGKDMKDEKFPDAETFEKFFNKVKSDCKKEHAILGFRRICQDGRQNKVAGTWFEALRKFPVARRYAVKYGNEYAIDGERRSGHPWFKPLLVDPIPAEVTADPEELESWYAPDWEWVLNLDAAERQKLAYDKKADQSTSASSEVYTDICKKNAGKIVFAASFIDEQGKLKDGSFADKFDLKTATEGAGIFGRAFWPRALSNYPIAKNTKTGKILYGPDGMNGDLMSSEILLKAFIDGKQIDNEFKVEDGLTSMTQRSKGKSGEVDFYAYSQTCRCRVLADDLNDPEQLRDSWHRAAGRFAYEFSKLSPGDHKVELQICFRLISSEDNAFALHPDLAAKKRLFPFYTTPVSTPIASGSFTLSVPNTPVPRRSILPKPVTLKNTAPAKREALEKQILDTVNASGEWGKRTNKKEVPFYVTITNDSHVSEVETFIVGEDSRGRILFREEPVRYGRDFRVLIRRKKSNGWPSETVAHFWLEAVSQKVRNPSTDIDDGIYGLWVAMGQHFEVDARLLSEADEKLLS